MKTYTRRNRVTDIETCRLCLTFTNDGVEIFGAINPVLTDLLPCLEIEIIENDGLPSKICRSCFDLLEEIRAFKTTCKAADNWLRQQAVRFVESTIEVIAHLTSHVTDHSPAVPISLFKVAIDEGDSEEEVTFQPYVIPERVDPWVIDEERLLMPEIEITAFERPDYPFNEANERRVQGTSWNSQPQGAPKADQNVQEKDKSAGKEIFKYGLNENISHADSPITLATGSTGTELESITYKEDENVVIEDTPHLDNYWNSRVSDKGSEKADLVELFSTVVSAEPYVEMRAKASEKVNETPTPVPRKVTIQASSMPRLSKAFKCETCSKVFASRSSIKKHQMLHSGVRLFRCVECSKTFNDSSTLKRHQLLHEDIFSYTCDICNRPFRQKTNLKHHIQVHLDAENKNPGFPCPTCNKTYKFPSGLSRHKLSHASYKCSKCTETFRFIVPFIRHMHKCKEIEQDENNGEHSNGLVVTGVNETPDLGQL